MQAIATAASVSRSALYAQFAGLDDLAVALLAETFEMIGELDAVDRADEGADVPTIAARAADRLVDHIHGRWDFYRASLDWSVGTRAHDALIEKFAEIVAASLAITHAEMTTAQRRDLALFVGGGAMSLIRRWLRSDAPTPPRMFAQSLRQCMPPEVVGEARSAVSPSSSSAMQSTQGES